MGRVIILDKRNNPTLLGLFWSFFKVGAFTFGGGFAMLPIIQREVVDRRKWIETEQFVDVLAVAQSGPGAVAINTAIFTGYKLLGAGGVVAATAGVVAPSFLIILTIAATLTAAGPSPLLTKAFQGIRPAVVALIVSAAIGVGKKVLKDSFSICLAGCALLVSLLTNIHPAFMILVAALIGYARYVMDKKKAQVSAK